MEEIIKEFMNLIQSLTVPSESIYFSEGSITNTLEEEENLINYTRENYKMPRERIKEFLKFINDCKEIPPRPLEEKEVAEIKGESFRGTDVFF